MSNENTTLKHLVQLLKAVVYYSKEIIILAIIINVIYFFRRHISAHKLFQPTTPVGTFHDNLETQLIKDDIIGKTIISLKKYNNIFKSCTIYL